MSDIQQGPSPAQELMQLALGYFASRAVHAAADLRLADLLADGPRSAADLARATNTHEPSLYRLLRALASVGLVAHRTDDRFELTEIGATLRSDIPGSTRPGVMMFHHPMFWRSWEALDYSLRTGKPALDHVFGKPVFDYLAGDPVAAAHYDGGMTGLNAALLPAILQAYDFGGFGTIVDVAGGHGSLLAAVLQAAPNAQGVLIDLPHVVEVARATFEARGLGNRARVVTGSIFEAVPRGGDAYLLKWIVHDWDDESCVRLLANIRAAMSPHARLLVIERVLPERIEATPTMRAMTMADLTMMIHLTGRERTEAEFRALFGRSGLALARIVPTASQLSVIEAIPG